MTSIGASEPIRSDNGPEFTAKAERRWLRRVGVQTLFIEPGSPWENGYVESFNAKLRDECLKLERFDTLLEARVLTERWRCDDNQIRPHSSRWATVHRRWKRHPNRSPRDGSRPYWP